MAKQLEEATKKAKEEAKLQYDKELEELRKSKEYVEAHVKAEDVKNVKKEVEEPMLATKYLEKSDSMPSVKPDV